MKKDITKEWNDYYDNIEYDTYDQLLEIRKRVEDEEMAKKIDDKLFYIIILLIAIFTKMYFL